MRQLEKGDFRFLSQFLKFWLPVLAYITLIFSLSSVSDLPGQELFPYMDKVAHFGEYGILGFLVGRAFRSAAPRFVTKFWFGLAIIAAIIVGVLDETYQSTVPQRVSSRYDFAADMIGAVAGLVALIQSGMLWKKNAKKDEYNP